MKSWTLCVAITAIIVVLWVEMCTRMPEMEMTLGELGIVLEDEGQILE